MRLVCTVAPSSPVEPGYRTLGQISKGGSAWLLDSWDVRMFWLKSFQLGLPASQDWDASIPIRTSWTGPRRAAALLDLSGSQNSTFSMVSGAFWVAQETLLRSPRDASEKPKRAQISPIRLLAA